MFHPIAITPVFLLASTVLAAPPARPSAEQQASRLFYRHAHVRGLVVEVEQASPDGMRQVAANIAAGLTDKGAGLQETLIDADGKRGSFVMKSRDGKRVTRIVLAALPGRPARFLAVIGSWPARLDALLSGQLDQEASAVEHSHAFDRGVESISYERNPS